MVATDGNKPKLKAGRIVLLARTNFNPQQNPVNPLARRPIELPKQAAGTHYRAFLRGDSKSIAGKQDLFQ